MTTVDDARLDASDHIKLCFTAAMTQGETIASACRQLNISRSTAYSWRKMWRRDGDAWWAVKGRTRYVYRSTPNLVWNSSLIEKVALDAPDWGCDRISEYLQDFNLRVSSPTVQEILIELELGTEAERANELRRRGKAYAIDPSEMGLTDDQKAYILRRDGQMRPSIPIGIAPGELLVQDGCWTVSSPGNNGYRANVIVDTFDNRMFCRLNTRDRVGSAVDAIDEVVAMFSRQGIAVGTVMTDHGHEFCDGDAGESYPAFLAGRGIHHIYFGVRGKNPRRPKIIANAWAVVVKEFLISKHNSDSGTPQSIEDLDAELSEWLQIRHGSR